MVQKTIFLSREVMSLQSGEGPGEEVDKTFLDCGFIHRAPIQAACLFVCSKYKEMCGNIEGLYIVISSNAYLKTQNKRKTTSVVVYCRFCGSKWRI